MNFEDLKIGDEVKSFSAGWGVYKTMMNSPSMYVVEFSNGYKKSYTNEGFYSSLETTPEIIDVKKKKWEPPSYKVHYRISGTGFIAESYSDGRKYADEGRVFATESSARDAYDNTIRPCQRLAAWVQEHAPYDIINFDWEDYDQEKYYPYYRENDSIWKLGTAFMKCPGLSYLLDKKIAQQLIDGLNDGTIELEEYHEY
jgi:hypothetical protein